MANNTYVLPRCHNRDYCDRDGNGSWIDNGGVGGGTRSGPTGIGLDTMAVMPTIFTRSGRILYRNKANEYFFSQFLADYERVGIPVEENAWYFSVHDAQYRPKNTVTVLRWKEEPGFPGDEPVDTDDFLGDNEVPQLSADASRAKAERIKQIAAFRRRRQEMREGDPRGEPELDNAARDIANSRRSLAARVPYTLLTAVQTSGRKGSKMTVGFTYTGDNDAHAGVFGPKPMLYLHDPSVGDTGLFACTEKLEHADADGEPLYRAHTVLASTLKGGPYVFEPETTVVRALDGCRQVHRTSNELEITSKGRATILIAGYDGGAAAVFMGYRGGLMMVVDVEDRTRGLLVLYVPFDKGAVTVPAGTPFVLVKAVA